MIHEGEYLIPYTMPTDLHDYLESWTEHWPWQWESLRQFHKLYHQQRMGRVLWSFAIIWHRVILTISLMSYGSILGNYRSIGQQIRLRIIYANFATGDKNVIIYRRTPCSFWKPWCAVYFISPLFNIFVIIDFLQTKTWRSAACLLIELHRP